MDKKTLDIFKEINKLNPEGDFLSNNSLSKVTEWIDTGSYALNAITSGSLYKGIPQGRIIGLVGPSQCGKTLMINKVIANFLKKDPNNFAVVWDSENAEDEKSAASVGADVSRIHHYPIQTIEDARNQISKLLDKIIESKLEGKCIVAVDSLGNLVAAKELADIEKDKSAADMGLRAKTMKAMIRALTYKAAKSKTTIIFSNHTYDDPASMYPSLVKNQSGGKGPIYLASLLIQFGVRQDKEENVNIAISPLANKVSGVTLTAMTTKNRFVPPFLKTELYLNFLTGLDRKSGLIDMAQGYNLIAPSGPVWVIPSSGKSLGYRKDWENDAKFWKEYLMPELEKCLQSSLSYSLTEQKDELDDETEATA